MQKMLRSGIADDASTARSGSAVAVSNAGHPNATVASLAVTSMSPSHVAQDGKRFEPNTYEMTFSFQGSYEHVVAAQSTATLWCANTATGAIDLYSCVTGQFVTSLLPLHEEVAARRAELAELPLNTPSSMNTSGGLKGASNGLRRPHWGAAAPTPRSRGLVPAGGGRSLSAVIPASVGLRVPESDVRATTMRATATHVWIGYTDGTVAVYDALLLKLNTFGQFHHDTVVSIVALCNGQTVSASADGLLVLWDTEQGGFEAVTRVTVLLDIVREGAGALCAMAHTQPAARVFCGFESGVVYSVLVASRPQKQTAPQALRGHSARVNDMVVVRDLLFTAAEDNTVCVWYCAGTDGARSEHRAVSSDAPIETVHDVDQTPQSPPTSGTIKKLKRISVKPCVRCFLAEEQTRSLWVAYADGLMERWSANPDDDYGVEEVVENALEPSLAADRGVRAVLSLSVAQTMQWLALSSNGVNKVWHGHKNTLEIDLAHSISALAQVVEQDTEDAAVWRERVNLLKQKEMERKEKYVFILEQLSEQRVLLRYYDIWKRSALFCGAQRRRFDQVAEVLQKKSSVQLLRRFFGHWGSFYDAQQRYMRSYVLSVVVSRTTELKQIQAYFLRWQSYVISHQMRQRTQRCAQVLARMVSTATMSSYFNRWRSVTVATTRRRHSSISAEQLALLANKAQRQVMQRVLRQWIAHNSVHKECQRQRATPTAGETPQGGPLIPGACALSRFAAHYAKLQDQRRGRQIFLVWKRWTRRRARQASLAAVAALREQQLLHESRLRFFLRWRRRVHARHMEENTQQLKALEVELRRAETEHGDIFEKLQLQRQLDLLLQRQAAEEAHAIHIRYQLESAEQTCTELRARQRQQGVVGSNSAVCVGMGGGGSSSSSVAASNRVAAGASAAVTQTDTARLSGTDMEFSLSNASENPSLIQQQQVVLSAMSRGHMASNAAWYRSLVDQQRLSPVVLAHMPIEEAVHHIMSQLKGNVVNLYTDLSLFRQVKDRRRAGTSAAGILLEAFGEVKRLIVTTVRGASANAASPVVVRMGGKATRWPLSMEALDCIPVHHCATVLSAIKTLVVAYDLLRPEETQSVQMTCEEVVANADWIFLIAHACYMRRKPLLPANNRQLA
ncbi:hypothetical protein JKF63_07167 [Porcisia hertigi]|uniref:Guanine nucleotide-binding protein subunit beta-like protein n=1 Tax=Porcisia hertigi TaxID=2761500 RepID=A0A836LKG1_9TRYP|nr:hypothetical protein JKF63_07167 [Porcisia hertigi]